MGVAVSFAKRAVRNWNATNRAIRYIDKVETRRREAPRRLTVKEASNQYEKAPFERDSRLEERVASFDIASEGIRKSILPEGFDYLPKSGRKLPQRFELGNPLPPPHMDFGFAVPECIPKGKITMRQAINMIKSYQLGEKTVPQLADEYALEVSMRDPFDAWVPPTGSKDKKTLLDAPIYQEDERLTDEGASRHLRLHEPQSPSKQ